VTGAATILHADLDAFFASVEQRDDPALRGRPVAVGGGVVLAASYEAKRFGVQSAMGGRRAQALCPDLVFVTPRFQAYVEASRAVFAIFADTSPVVERMSIDEAFLDVRGLGHISGTPTQIAVALRHRVREEAGLAISIGVARTKFLAKVASGAAKPDGLLVVEPDEELNFLGPLPVQALWGVGAKTATVLHAHGLMSVADIRAQTEAVLVALLGGSRGRHLHALAHNRDSRPVRTAPRRRSVGAQRALGPRPRPFAEIATALAELVDRVTRRLRGGGRQCRTVVLRLRFSDYERATRSRTLARPTSDTATIAAAARDLLEAQRQLIRERGLTLVGVALMGLSDVAAAQLELPLDTGAQLDATLDRVKDRFGAAAITRGSLVGQPARESTFDYEP
jgi:DNA polymerase-4